jgi:hypothetical protein
MREELTALIEGRLSTGSAKDALVKLATRLIARRAMLLDRIATSVRRRG